MSGFVAEIDAHAAEAAQEAAAGGNGDFPPLAPGKYQAHVVEVVKVEDFGGNGGNAKKKVLRLKLQIVDNSPTGRKRVFFVRVPLFTRYAPTEKNPQGAPARGFWDFFGKAIGWPQERLILGDMPGPADVQGKQITITLSAPIPPDNYNPLGSNEVSFYDAPGDVNASPTHPATAPWLANGELDPNWRPAGAAPQGAPAYGQAPQAAPAAPPAWGQPPAAAPAAPPAWAPAPADVAYAQAATGQPQQQGF